ncbi:DNA-binding protein [Stenotrophomonas sp. S39]|uniref:DNA-binding protein n=1 Tax=Stenotrophomonas sp. S39 TaxID=2767451 RepID=UPI00190AAA51|nr:DNA-binding protein [Stenotrophomonas sp. S39]MBK0052664.1 DNA-binding protein [Stenotrophomonas sp. S39]
MAKGISEQDVHNAADDIVGLGERPTVERIRAHLGTGSPNTVTRWLETWWQTIGLRLRQRAIEATVPGVPERVANLSQRLWQAAMQDAGELARGQLDAAQRGLEDRERLLKDDRATMAREIESSQKREHEAQSAAAAAVAAGELLSAQVAQLSTQIQDLLRQRDGAYARAERLEQELQSTRRSLVEVNAAHEEERRALQTHVRAVEDRAHAEVDLQRQTVRTAEQEWGRERAGLASALRQSEQQTNAAADREQQALRRLEGAVTRANGLEAQLTSLKETTSSFAEALRQGQSSPPGLTDAGKPRRAVKKTRRSTPRTPGVGSGEA